MAWIIIVITWAAVTALVGYPYVEKIQKVRNDGKRVFFLFCGCGRRLVDTHCETCGKGTWNDFGE